MNEDETPTQEWFKALLKARIYYCMSGKAEAEFAAIDNPEDGSHLRMADYYDARIDELMAIAGILHLDLD